jgi:hypothetical protein
VNIWPTTKSFAKEVKGMLFASVSVKASKVTQGPEMSPVSVGIGVREV